MKPGDTLIGMDLGGDHLSFILSDPVDGMVAFVNVTTKRPGCPDAYCVHILPGEHPRITRESCAYFRKAELNPVAPLDDYRERGLLRQSVPASPEILRRLQEGALANPFTLRDVKVAIRRTMERNAN